MARTIELQEDKLIIRLSGLTSVAALKQQVEIPFAAIRNVYIEDFDVSLFNFRVGTSGFGVREGRFLMDGKWCFLSFENHENVVVLELEDHEFWKVVFQHEAPETIKEMIINRLK